MARQKIREKKPSDKIKSKIPVSSREQEIKQKTPEKYDVESFELPPPKQRGGIAKDEVKLPSDHGSFDQNKKDSFKSTLPPIKESVPYEAKSPSNKGLIPNSTSKKSALNKKTPVPKQINKINTIPRSTGVVHSKKALSNTVNRPPPKIQRKIPKKGSNKHPIMGGKKENKTSINQPPPPKIHMKTPVKKKITPPPIFEDIKAKIPKTKLKAKKPK
ncbi:MAG: hypothetical protein ACFFB5_14490 [Promethearchaeota archaeon]